MTTGFSFSDPDSWGARVLLWVRMTRPAFLLLTVVACVLGTATAAACGCGVSLPVAAATTVLAVLAHAVGNVFNDLQDARNGADAGNHGGIYPFTGGSRLIQRGETTQEQTAELVKALLLMLVPAGLLLAAHAGSGVLWLGLAGVFLAWAYSAPPLQLMSRGMGELAVALVWFLVVLGADYVQRHRFFIIPVSAAFSLAVLTAALLLANSVPDSPSDEKAGKRTLVTCLGVPASVWVYLLLVLLAHGWLLLSVWWLVAPASAAWGLVSLPLSLLAWWVLWRRQQTPGRLAPALGLTVAAALLHGLGQAAGYVLVLLQR